MSNLEEARNELIELENIIALTMDEMKNIRENLKDGVERRKLLVKLQMRLGKDTRRLNELRKLV